MGLLTTRPAAVVGAPGAEVAVWPGSGVVLVAPVDVGPATVVDVAGMVGSAELVVVALLDLPPLAHPASTSTPSTTRSFHGPVMPRQ